MIVHSPNSPMPPPYGEYVAQRAEGISSVLEDVVKGDDVQLCPRAILAEEKYFSDQEDALVYGCVVKHEEDGHKTALYGMEGNPGKFITSEDAAMQYIKRELHQDRRVRMKDPSESDCLGQLTIETEEEAHGFFESVRSAEAGVVLMPHLDSITDRFMACEINLGKIGVFKFFGREIVGLHEGREAFLGADILVAREENEAALEQLAQNELDIPPEVMTLGARALSHYEGTVLEFGRASVDVIRGETDSKESIVAPIDVSPRVGGTSPAEVLAIRQIVNYGNAACRASVRLLYDAAERPQHGTNFVDTPSLIINAEITKEY